MAAGGLASGLALVGLVTLVEPGCGGGSSSGVDGGPGAVVIHPPWKELPKPALSVEGGTALSARGQGQPGGTVHFVAQGDVSFDSSAPAPAAPMVPSAPAGAMTLDAAALAADVSASDTVVISGDVTTGGSDAVRKIASSGDLFVTGKLRAADLGGSRQEIDLQAGGTLYISGSVDTSGGSGQAGGAIHLTASQVVITGKVLASGGDGDGAAGPAGAVTIAAMQSLAFSGSIEAFGGNATGGGMVTGGSAGALTITGGAVGLVGTVLVRGGAASAKSGGSAQGGAAAAIVIDASGAIDLGGIIDARGGLATGDGDGGAVVGGAAGKVQVGEKTAAASIAIHVPVAATGGAGNDVGGVGGTVTPEPGAGNVNVAGAAAINVSGGDSLTMPGTGGQINGGPRTDPGSGGLHISGEMFANGGSILQGGGGNGADGGRIDFELAATDGPVMIDQSAKVTAEGGKAEGGTAGGGGHIWMFTKDGDLTVAGNVSVRGGDASNSAGTGGPGGQIYFFSDNNHNAVDVGKGNLLITSTGHLDASGGDGAIGGNARNDGTDWVADFPDMQEEIAIFLNCDGQHGETKNWMENDGMLIARGGVHNGNGGDIVYHGIGPGQLGMPTDGSGNHHPPPGNQDMAPDGTGMPGVYGGE